MPVSQGDVAYVLKGIDYTLNGQHIDLYRFKVIKNTQNVL